MNEKQTPSLIRIDNHQCGNSEAGSDRNARRLNALADLEVDMQNAVLCIRLRGDDESMAEESTLRRAA